MAEENADPKMEEDLDDVEKHVREHGRFIPELMNRLERGLATEALDVWEAFASFCEEEMDLSAEKMLQATFPPVLEDVGWFRELCERLGLEADRTTVDEYRRYMRARW